MMLFCQEKINHKLITKKAQTLGHVLFGIHVLMTCVRSCIIWNTCFDGNDKSHANNTISTIVFSQDKSCCYN